MDSLSAMMMGQFNLGKPHRVFDWHVAAKLIREHKPKHAAAGLCRDWEYTGGSIYRDVNPVPREDTYTYLSSNWAMPELEMDGMRQGCWVYQEQSPGWDHETYWPESALAILRGDPSATEVSAEPTESTTD